MRRPFRRKSKPQPRPQSRDHLYRYYKTMWEAAHPEATPAEYDAAIAKITKELGL